MMYSFDHLAVTAVTLEEGAAYVEAALGVTLGPGGAHPDMGTHNRLLSLGNDTYLEVITVNPDAPKPAHARWFGLDDIAGPPSLSHWICRVDDMDAAVAEAPPFDHTVMQLQRDDLVWRMLVPNSGHLPYDNAFPGVIDWGQTPHPSARMTDANVRLTGLEVAHPQVDEMLEACPSLRSVPAVAYRTGPKKITATFSTPNGERTLS